MLIIVFVIILRLNRYVFIDICQNDLSKKDRPKEISGKITYVALVVHLLLLKNSMPNFVLR